MPNWTGLVMTRAGKKLQIKAMAGAQLNFTRLKLGDGQLAEGQHIESLNDLISPKQVLTISECKVTQDGLCEISSIVSNSGLTSQYYARELGVFATDPDDGEILYAVSQDDKPDYMPEDGGSVPITHNFKVYINVGNIEDVTGTIDIGGWATSGYVLEQLDNHDKDPNAHYNMTGATSGQGGKRGFVPAPSAGANTKYLRGDGSWATPQDTTYKTMVGSSQYAAGAQGLVPAPSAGENTKYLRGDGKWENPSYPPTMTGATQYNAGKQGLAPAPSAGANTKYLRGDGSWAIPQDTTYKTMVGSSQYAAGAQGLVPAPSAGENTKYLRGDGKWENVPGMTGATSTAAGAQGLVPAPSAAEREKFLRGDGKWANTPYPPNMTGATSSSAGKNGMVPAPAAGSQLKVLFGDGQWKSIIDLLYPVGRIIISMDPTNPATLYGGTWERIGSGRTIIDCGGGYTAGTPGGAATVTLTEAQMPKHKHSGTTSESGDHAHTRGTMDITGRILSCEQPSRDYTQGAFYHAGEWGSNNGIGANGSDGRWINYFKASNSWTGQTSTNGKHSHTFTTSEAGSGTAHNNMPPYMPAYIWRRIA